AGGEGLLLPDLKVGTVHAVGDAVVLPGEVVVALAHEAAVRLVGVAWRRLPGAGLDAEGLALLRGERGLEDQLVGRVVTVAVDELRENGLPLVVHDDRLGGIQSGRVLAQLRERERDRLRTARRRERVLNLDGNGRNRGIGRQGGRRRGDEQGDNGQCLHAGAPWRP